MTLASVVSTVAWGIFVLGLIKRAHDLGLSGWYILIPFFGFWLFFAPGGVPISSGPIPGRQTKQMGQPPAEKRLANGPMKRRSGDVSTMAKVTSLKHPAKSLLRACWNSPAI